MKIVADKNIQGLEHTFAKHGECILLPPEAITAKSLKDADGLLCRSTVKINEDLLFGTKVQWVGSCVSGEDHIDHAYLEAHDIHFYGAKGCNAQAVVDWTLMAIELCRKEKPLPKNFKVAIIGVGCIGSRLNEQLLDLGVEATLCDPLRRDLKAHVPFEQIQNMDLVCIHTPLTKVGEYPTYHMLDEPFFEKQKAECVIINPARADLIDSTLLEKRLNQQTFCLDVWHGEPEPNLNQIQEAFIATPHIAGHTLEAKLRGTEMMFERVAKDLGWEVVIPDSKLLKPCEFSLEKVSFEFKRAMTESADVEATFKALRQKFGQRREGFQGTL